MLPEWRFRQDGILVPLRRNAASVFFGSPCPCRGLARTRRQAPLKVPVEPDFGTSAVYASLAHLGQVDLEQSLEATALEHLQRDILLVAPILLRDAPEPDEEAERLVLVADQPAKGLETLVTPQLVIDVQSRHSNTPLRKGKPRTVEVATLR